MDTGDSLGVKRPEREAYYSFPSSVKIKNAWSYIPFPIRSMAWYLDSTGTTLPFYNLKLLCSFVFILNLSHS